ncbi:hypothetical protein [Spiroplasma endosymbiont of Agriotes lineatus]|uniref:hypothetical protein n=1 Tax=Spiroplasma endosymbiont of Agriotes lineatus TaxID=3077930 RepID=UPI0030D27961
MTLMIMGAVMIFLATLLGVFLLVLSMPVIFNFITNEIFLKKLFLRFDKENFSFALIKLKNNLMSNLIIYVFFGILMMLFFVLLTIVVSQICYRKNHKVVIRLFYTNFALTGTIFTVLILMIIFTGIQWFSFVLAVLAMGLLFLQNSFLSLIKNSINHKINCKEYQINNIVTDVARKINNEKFLDITNEEIVNIKRNNTLSLEKEQLHSEFFNDKEHENADIDNNKLLVKSEESLPDILNPMLLKENEDDCYEIPKIIKEPIYEEIATDEMLFNSQITAERVVVSNEKQQLDSNNNVVLSQKKVDSQLRSCDSKHMDINNEDLQVRQPRCSYVTPRGDLQFNYAKQPQPLMSSNSVQTGNGEYGSGKQLFANEYYQQQQYPQVQSQILDSNNNVVLSQKKVDSQLRSCDSKHMDINNEDLQVRQPRCSYVTPRGDLQFNYAKQPLMSSNSVQTGNGEYGSGKQLFANEYYQQQQYPQVQSQILDSNNNVVLSQKKVDSQLRSCDSKHMDINNEDLQVRQPRCSYVTPRGDLQFNYAKQPQPLMSSNSVQTGNGEYGSGKQLFANEYYQQQQYPQVQSQILDSNNNVVLSQKKVDSQLRSCDSKHMDINNEDLQVRQPRCSYVTPRGDLQFNYAKQPLMSSNSVQTGNGEYGSGKQLFANEYYQQQQYPQVQSQILDSNNNVVLSQKKVDSQLRSCDSKHMDINNEDLQVRQPRCSYVTPRGDLQFNYAKQPQPLMSSNSVQTGNGEYGSGKQLFANEYYQQQQYPQVQSQILDSNNNVVLSQKKVDSQLRSCDSKHMDINNEDLQVRQPRCSYVTPRGDLQFNYAKQPLMSSNSVQTGNGEYGSGKQLFANEYYQQQQYPQVQSQILDSNNNVVLSQKKVDSQLRSCDSKHMDINNEDLQVRQPRCSYVTPRGDLQFNYAKQPQPLMSSNSVQTGNGEYGSGKQLFANEYYQQQQYPQVQSQILDSNNNVVLSQKKVDSQLRSCDSKHMDINNEDLQVRQPRCSYVTPRGDLQFNYAKQPLMSSNSVQTGNGEYGSGKQLFANEYYQQQQYPQVQSQILDSNNNVVLSQKKVDSQLRSCDSKHMDINNEDLQVRQPRCSYVTPRGDLQFNYAKQPQPLMSSNSVQTGNGEYGSGKQLFANEYYQQQQYPQVQSQILDSNNNVVLSQKKVDSQLRSCDSKHMDINNEDLQVRQPRCSYVTPRGDLQFNYAKQPLMSSNSVQTGNGEYGSGKQLFANEYYQQQQYPQVQSQILDSNNNVVLSQKKVDSQLRSCDSKHMDINNEDLQVRQPRCSYVTPRGDLQFNYAKQPQPLMSSNSVQTGNGEYGSGKQLFANESHQNPNLDVDIALNDSRNLFNQDDVVDTMIDPNPNKIYYHSPMPMTRKTIAINQQETQKFLFANLPGKPDELKSPVYEYNPIEEQNKKPKQDKNKNQESHSYRIFDQTMQRQANTGMQKTVSYPQEYVYVQARSRYQTKSNYYEQQPEPALNINLPKQETYNKSIVNQQIDSSAVAEHYHSQYPNYTFTNDGCPICYQGGVSYSKI